MRNEHALTAGDWQIEVRISTTRQGLGRALEAPTTGAFAGERLLELVYELLSADRSAPAGNGGSHGALRLEALGRDRALVRLGGGEFGVSQRHSEILVLLAAHPAGMTGEQLAIALYGDAGKPVTARAEVSRLRRLLGECIAADPYRIDAAVESDINEVARLLRGGRAMEAAAHYPGPILPRSTAPGIVELRDELEGWTRRAVVASNDVDALWAWLNTTSGEDDMHAWKRFLANVPHEDGRRSLAAARLARLRPLLTVVADPRPSLSVVRM
jgi:hypothetical protein